MMEVELLRDVVGRLMEVRGPTKVPPSTMQSARAAMASRQAQQQGYYVQQQHQQHPQQYYQPSYSGPQCFSANPMSS